MKTTRGNGARRWNWAACAAFAAAFLLMAGTAGLKAQQAGQQTGQRAVRLSYVEGQVQISQGNQILAQQAPVNAPLFEGSQITTADDGRAEVEFEDGSVARLSPNSSMTLSVLRQEGDATDTEVLMQSGLGYFELQGDSAAGRMRVRFGSNVASASGFTVLRVDLDNPPGELAVFSGNAHLDNGGTMSVDMHGGETVRLNAADPTNWALVESIDPDSWDAWNADRDQALTAQEAARTQATTNVPQSANPAWSDLDANGEWYDVPGQGNVWSPYEAQNAGWDPYGWGSWMWTPGMGYGWVSGEPWGFMPYAMGMWNYYPGFGWGWMPGGGYWWGGGGGWASNVGNGPQRYQPPQPPIQPRGGPVLPKGGAGMLQARYVAHPVITVNRMPPGATRVTAPVSSQPRVIAGNTVQPMRPLAPRATYTNSFQNSQGRQMAVFGRPTSGVHYGYSGNPYGSTGGRQGYWAGSSGSRQSGAYGRPVSPGGGSYGGHVSSSGGGSHISGGGGGFHGGGGGGGGSHNGGGGGGGSHGGGGGGGGGHR